MWLTYPEARNLSGCVAWPGLARCPDLVGFDAWAELGSAPGPGFVGWVDCGVRISARA